MLTIASIQTLTRGNKKCVKDGVLGYLGILLMTLLKKLLTNFGTVNSKSICQTKYCRKSGRENDENQKKPVLMEDIGNLRLQVLEEFRNMKSSFLTEVKTSKMSFYNHVLNIVLVSK